MQLMSNNIDLEMDEISEEQRAEIAEIQARLDNDGMRGVHELLLHKFEEIRQQPLTIAVIGSSGAGKSTFINAIRGLTSEDDSAAPTGCTETTLQPTVYAQPGNEKLKFWDLPGVGTQNFPQDRYLELIKFGIYDFFLILSESRFTEQDLWLSKEITNSKRQFFFVRTKVANDVSSNRRTYPTKHNEDAVLKAIRENIEAHLHRNSVEGPVFLVDSLKRDKFDFNKLEMQLFKDFPSIKRMALILAMSNYSSDVIKEKIKVLRWEIWKLSLLAASAAAVPLAGASAATDVSILVGSIIRYLKILGLDDDSLRLTSERTGCELTTLTALVHELFPPSVAAISSMRELTVFAANRGVQSYVTEIAKYVPLIGRAIAATLSFYTIYRTLHNLLDDMELLALQVVRVSVEGARAREDTDDE